MLDPSNIMMAAATMPLFIATYYFGRKNGFEQSLEAMLNVMVEEGMITDDDEDISSESDQD